MDRQSAFDNIFEGEPVQGMENDAKPTKMDPQQKEKQAKAESQALKIIVLRKFQWMLGLFISTIIVLVLTPRNFFVRIDRFLYNTLYAAYYYGATFITKVLGIESAVSEVLGESNMMKQAITNYILKHADSADMELREYTQADLDRLKAMKERKRKGLNRVIDEMFDEPDTELYEVGGQSFN